MKRLALTLLAFISLGLGTMRGEARTNDPAQMVASTPMEVSADDVSIVRNGTYLTIDMVLDLDRLKVPGNKAVLLTPRLTNGTQSLDLPAVGIYSHRRYYTYKRQDGRTMISGPKEIAIKASDKPDRLPYHTDVTFQPWMDGATLTLERADYGCCNSIYGRTTADLGTYIPAVTAPVPTAAPQLDIMYAYVRPVAEKVKTRSLSGRAFIDYPVNKTVIYPDYRSNDKELAKIRATIDTVRLDADVHITALSIKGFASPEGPWDNNVRLAKSRTESLKEYVQQLYSFPAGLITTSYEPEDWAGLLAYVEKSSLPHREAIIELIRSDREPDNKEWKLKSTYPDDYAILLRDVYPALRHSDYLIDYTVRGYEDVAEISRVLATRPQNLSLREFYLLAQTLEPGSDEFAEVFETAVRMFPTDATANLNAGISALQRDDLRRAAIYLDKAGTSPEAIYARGILAHKQGDNATARTLLGQAASLGLSQASALLDQLP